ncbi:hypothetical protein T484DRAFT_1860389 [Baffinella frigidus]|nr:hypothetical protein T484DRAFT_1860389 [Cryptophyta sp. CCMP2293]
MTLALDFASIPEGSDARTQFLERFVSQVSRAGGVPVARIIIRAITSGSVVVSFQVAADPSEGSPTPLEVAGKLLFEAADPASTLLQGSVTGFIAGLSGDGITAEAIAAAAAAVATAFAASGAELPGTLPPRRAVSFGASLPAFVTRCKSLELAGTCFGCCRRRCEDGPDNPEASGKEVAAGLRAGLCREVCFDACKAAGP